MGTRQAFQKILNKTYLYYFSQNWIKAVFFYRYKHYGQLMELDTKIILIKIIHRTDLFKTVEGQKRIILQMEEIICFVKTIQVFEKHIINIKFFHITQTMAENEQLFSYLHKIFKSLSVDSNTSQLNEKQEKSFDQKNIENFNKKVNENLGIVKERIVNIIENIKQQGIAIKLKKMEKELLKEIQSILNMLNKEINYLLQEGILNVYIQLLSLREKTSKNQVHLVIQILIQDIIQTMSKLLFSYFCYKQYKIRTQKLNHRRVISIFSEKNIDRHLSNTEHKQQSQFDYQLMEEIEESMKEKSIHQIIKQNMKKEIAKMTEEESICRICQQKAKLRNMQKHVKICQKKHDLKQECEIKKRKMSSLLNQMRSKLSSINQKSIKSKQDQSLKAIITSLLHKQNSRKEKGAIRRSQTFISTSGNQLLTFINLIQQHLQLYGQHQTLNEICRIRKELVVIEKNISGLQNVIHSLELNNQYLQQPKPLVRRNSRGRSSKNSLQILSTLNSLNMQDELNSRLNKNNVQFDLQDSSSDQDEKQNKVIHKSMKQQLIQQTQIMKKFQSKQSFRDKQNKQLNTIRQKNYVSLQEIPLNEQIDKKISFSDFQVLKFIGKGAYGKVYMVRRKQTKDVYALKIITLSDKITEKELQLISKQHQIYKKIEGDYLVKAPFSFNEKSSHMFVLEYMPGGDLRKLLTQQVYFQQKVAQFYLAEMVLAIEHLHTHNIIHRDLKPQNLVLDEEGHIKLTDFGLSELKFENMLKQTKKLNENVTNIRRCNRRAGFRHGMSSPNLIGTPDYIAPQIINNVSTTNLTIDWWSLGVIAYELIIGTRPFCADSIEEIIQNIKSFNIQWPEVGDQEGMITQKAKSFIESLLDKDFLNRLGANGADEIKSHPFFEGIDWENIMCSKPPFNPNIQKKKEEFSASEDKILRQSIQRMINLEQNSNPKLKLQKFVRFDLLRSETIQNLQKIVNEKANHIIKLKTLQKLQKLNIFQKQDQEK